MGIYYKRRDPSTWKRELEEANQTHMKPPLAADEVAGVIRSLERKEYEYTCKVEPMFSHCDSMTCRGRRWGVGDEGNLPIIAGLSKLDTRPAIWFVDVMGVRLELTTDQLYDYRLFTKSCMEEGTHTFGPMKQASWHSMLNEAMKHCVMIEAPDDVGVQGRFHEYLEEFLTNRQKGERREDLFSDRPWEDEEEQRHYFRLGALQKFFKREDVRDERSQYFGRNRLATMIQRLGGGPHFFNIRGRGCSVWWVPSSTVQSLPEVEPPPVKGAPL
jgi:hypothetical protein